SEGSHENIHSSRGRASRRNNRDSRREDLCERRVTLLLSILLSDIGPIFAIAAVGFLVEKRASGSAGPLSKISFNVLSPCLVFNQLVTSKIAGADVGRMALYGFLLIGAMGTVAWVAATALRLDPKTRGSFLLVVM